jgi:hypothetical protein
VVDVTAAAAAGARLAVQVVTRVLGLVTPRRQRSASAPHSPAAAGVGPGGARGGRVARAERARLRAAAPPVSLTPHQSESKASGGDDVVLRTGVAVRRGGSGAVTVAVAGVEPPAAAVAAGAAGGGGGGTFAAAAREERPGANEDVLLDELSAALGRLARTADMIHDGLAGQRDVVGELARREDAALVAIGGLLRAR